jgi:hypothetical protein
VFCFKAFILHSVALTDIMFCMPYFLRP